MKRIIISIILYSIVGFLMGVYLVWKLADRAICEQSISLKRAKSYYEVLNQWLKLKINGRKVEDFFIENQYKTIAIYGYAELGHRLYEELKDSNMTTIKYIIDQNADDIYENIAIYKPEKGLPKVDAIVITPIFASAEIERNLLRLIDSRIVSLSEVISEL